MIERLRPVFFIISSLLCLLALAGALGLLAMSLIGLLDGGPLEAIGFVLPALIFGLILYCEIQLFVGGQAKYYRALGYFWFTIGTLSTFLFVVAVLGELDSRRSLLRFDIETIVTIGCFAGVGLYGLLCGAIRAFGRRPVIAPRGFVVDLA